VDWAEAPAQRDADGVVLHDAARSQPGANLVTYPGLRRAELLGADGRLLRRWEGRGHRRWERARLLPGGDLLVLVRRPGGLLRLAADGGVLWQTDLPLHHDVRILSDGRLATLTSRRVEVPEIHPGPLWDNGVALLSPEGALLEERSLLDVLASDPEQLPVVTAGIEEKEGKPLDLFHANYLDWIEMPRAPGADPRFAPGAVLATLRHQDAVVLFDWRSGELLWSWGRGQLRRPHDASVLEDGNVLIFDNQTGADASRIVEVDPSTDRIVWEYRAQNPTDFYTGTRGTVQRLANGNTLIAESNAGRGFEVTRSGEVVWEYLAPRNADGHRPAFRLERVPLDALPQ
jgi:outer membrane protein assembly factor BamB